MRHCSFILFATLTSSISLQAQTLNAPPPPQTARQALLEMFIGKSADAFTKHLPDVARQALVRKGETPETSLVQKISTIGHQFTAQGEHMETFDAGPTLLVSEQKQGQEKVEVLVEHDYLMGDQDEIEISIHVSRNGEAQFLPVVPRIVFSMIQEKDIWRLSEATLALHAPLTDQDYLRGIRKMADEANENMASARVILIVNSETTFAASHPDRGYTCNLSELFGKSQTTGAPAQPPDGSPADFSSPESSGYHFALSGCGGAPASKYQVTAVPTDADAKTKAFCADESGTVRFEPNGKGAICLTRGQVLQAPGAVFTSVTE